MVIRHVHETEHGALADLTEAAYRAVPGEGPSASYTAVLRDVADRVRHAEVAVAVDDAGEILGGVTYVADPASPYAEFEAADEACFRMLAVDPRAQGRGVGAALVEWCIARARANGKMRLSLLTTPSMAPAHRLYERFGFRRAPEFDMIVERRLELRAYVLDL
ncbi:MAG: GNAT family N-acetyltransferase [Gaiellales bacterium]